MKCLRIVAALSALAVAACGQSPSQKSADESKPAASAAPKNNAGSEGAATSPQSAKQSADQLAQGLQQMAQGLQQLGAKDASGKPVAPVDFEKLEALLPNPSGWTKGKPSGQQTTMVVSTSNAQASYTKGDANVQLEITDSALNQMLLAPMSFMLAAGYSERTSSGYKKSMSLGGSPGFEEWNSDDKHGEIGVVVGNRFIVSGKGDGLDNIDSLRSIVQGVDFAKLGALK
jgi:hypothetical protein